MKRFNMITLLLVVVCLTALPVRAEEAMKVKFLAGVTSGAFQHTYRTDLLKLALEQSGESYTVEVAEQDRTATGMLEEMANSSEPLVVASGTTPEFEEKLLPVRVPIYLGMGIGYRLMLIRQEIQESLRSVKTLDDLNRFTFGQGTGWSDVAILRNAGLTVVEGTKYETLFEMTTRGRFDLFSRGLFEIFLEYDRYKKEFPELMVDDHLLVVYPNAMYFFVPRSQQRLHDVIYQGLVSLYESGAMQTLLLEHPTLKDTFDKARLNDRVRIDLPPYNMTDETVKALQQFRLILQ